MAHFNVSSVIVYAGQVRDTGVWTSACHREGKRQISRDVAGVESSDREGQVRRKSGSRLLLRYVVIETRLYLSFSKPEIRVGQKP